MPAGQRVTVLTDAAIATLIHRTTARPAKFERIRYRRHPRLLAQQTETRPLAGLSLKARLI